MLMQTLNKPFVNEHMAVGTVHFHQLVALCNADSTAPDIHTVIQKCSCQDAFSLAIVFCMGRSKGATVL